MCGIAGMLSLTGRPFGASRIGQKHDGHGRLNDRSEENIQG